MTLDSESINRRTFLAAAAAGTAMSADTADAEEIANLPRPTETRKGDMLYRSFGKTGETVSVVGVGGSHIGQTSSQDLATKIIRTAIDHGVNFMDNSWDYNNGDGEGETKMGKALRDG
jgi:hypothetical protein